MQLTITVIILYFSWTLFLYQLIFSVRYVDSSSTLESTYLHITRPLTGYDTRPFFKQLQPVWSQCFPSPRPVGITRSKSQVCPTIFPLLKGVIFNLSKMQTLSSKFWTRVTMYISYYDNRFATNSSLGGAESPLLCLCSSCSILGCAEYPHRCYFSKSSSI